MSPLAKRIKEMLTETQQTASAAARGAGIDRQVISNVLKDPRRGLHSTTLTPLAIWFGVNEAWLLEGTEPKYRPAEKERAVSFEERFYALSPAKQKILLAHMRLLEEKNNNSK